MGKLVAVSFTPVSTGGKFTDSRCRQATSASNSSINNVVMGISRFITDAQRYKILLTRRG